MTAPHGRAGRRMPAAIVTGPVRAVVLTGLAAVLAACSAGGTGPAAAPVASLPSGAGQAGRAPARPLTQEQSDLDMVQFTRCMRSHGVTMPDPYHRPGHTGLSIDLPTQDAATRSAYAVCSHYMAAIVAAKQAGAAALSAPRLAALTRYAECMRGHDINMLDPTTEGELNLGTVPGVSSDFGRYSPQFRAADTACRHLLPAGVGDDGTGP